MPRIGYKQTEEHKAKMSLAKKGRKYPKMSLAKKGHITSEETKRRMSIAQKGRISPMKGRHHSEETRKKLSIAHKGRNTWSKGRKLSIEHRRKLSEAGKRVVERGENNFYIDGRTPENAKIRHSLEYKLWREAVFKRDNWTCIWCGQWGGQLQADHIKTFAEHPELRFAIDNGRTLCVKCHKKTDSYGWKYASKILAIIRKSKKK